MALLSANAAVVVVVGLVAVSALIVINPPLAASV
jgi:hypothetical protein